jgi:hypothetical protein
MITVVPCGIFSSHANTPARLGSPVLHIEQAIAATTVSDACSHAGAVIADA